ncbi:DUF6516 family protein [uncultured Thiodictyon sp.]|uniref:toxin-antitoxin system TumE family protein n=1 Tax=uncultured Thiodictyon sp. TaxID=1846217 RepID=UPI0025FC54F9|nr:DUF6516 family protein [uncultured Thiodictyon sp.]
MNERSKQGENAFAELRVWRVPEPVRWSAHIFKYRLAFVVDGVCVVRFDNEAGKGDHRHLGPVEMPYSFTTLPELLADFWRQVDNWRG